MPIYAIGDVQGCFEELQALLERVHFEPARDQLWLTGDLVNRGPRSADVLRFVMGLGEHAISVLGNHDLHLLAVAMGHRRRGKSDTFADVLEARDRDALLDWLRHRPLLHHDDALRFTLVHAALLPQWDLADARVLASEVEAVLRGPHHREFLSHMYGDAPESWSDSLIGWDRLRIIVNTFTRLRYCDREGRMDLTPVGAPGSQPGHLLPWFQVPARRSHRLNIVFGHWSTLGAWCGNGVVALDSGCQWGGALTAVRLDGTRREFYRVPCRQWQAP